MIATSLVHYEFTLRVAPRSSNFNLALVQAAPAIARLKKSGFFSVDATGNREETSHHEARMTQQLGGAGQICRYTKAPQEILQRVYDSLREKLRPARILRGTLTLKRASRQKKFF
jgi:hypothetical protein